VALESEVRFLRGYLKACGLRPPESLSQPGAAERQAPAALEVGKVEIPVPARPAFSPPPPELLLKRRVVTAARWGGAEEFGAARLMTAVADNYPDGTPATFRVYRRDVEEPVAVVTASVRDGRVQAVWGHGDLADLPAPSSGDVELYFDVEVDREHGSRSKVATRAQWIGGAAPAPVEEAVPEAPRPRARALSGAQWSTSSARVKEPVDLYAAADGFADATPARIEIYAEDDEEPLEWIDAAVQNGAIQASWETPLMAADQSLEFVVRIEGFMARSDRMDVRGDPGRRRGPRGRRADDLAERVRPPTRPPLAPPDNPPPLPPPPPPPTPLTVPEATKAPAAPPTEAAEAEPLAADPPTRIYIGPLPTEPSPAAAATTPLRSRPAPLPAAAPPPQPADGLPDDTNSTTEYSRDAILAAMAKLGPAPAPASAPAPAATTATATTTAAATATSTATPTAPAAATAPAPTTATTTATPPAAPATRPVPPAPATRLAPPAPATRPVPPAPATRPAAPAPSTRPAAPALATPAATDVPEGATTQFSRDAIRQALGLPQTPAPEPPEPPAGAGAMDEDADTPPDAGDADLADGDDDDSEDNEGREGTKFYKPPTAPPKKR
jgi:uncharacterized protein YbaA (DUF1428 family)